MLCEISKAATDFHVEVKEDDADEEEERPQKKRVAARTADEHTAVATGSRRRQENARVYLMITILRSEDGQDGLNSCSARIVPDVCSSLRKRMRHRCLPREWPVMYVRGPPSRGRRIEREPTKSPLIGTGIRESQVDPYWAFQWYFALHNSTELFTINDPVRSLWAGSQ